MYVVIIGHAPGVVLRQTDNWFTNHNDKYNRSKQFLETVKYEFDELAIERYAHPQYVFSVLKDTQDFSLRKYL